ncbi:MAG: TauD/TfdA family dioxygenase [Novosphingobium sp.]|nr:TauD/TfdA family dioxygenase [Novosphingobium sp.]MCP5401244.1 TauD/TfdA family dioxygenase [Novosphingobium sp.]
MAIRFEDIKPKIGSRVVWDDRKDLFTPEAAEAIRRKVEERTVIVFPKLNLTDEEQLQITDLMGGKVKLTGQFNRQENDDNVYQVTLDRKINPQPEYVLGTYFYHMDGMPVEMPPPFATLLSARKVAQKGGQTEFASTYAGFEGLPEEERKELEKLTVIHSVKASMIPIHDAIPEEDYERVIGIQRERERPLVFTHADGHKSMLLGTTADRVVGMSIPESRALLIRLVEWCAQPEYSLRHDWEEGDFVIWENTSALHRAIPYDFDSGRMMHRTSIAGTEAVPA